MTCQRNNRYSATNRRDSFVPSHGPAPSPDLGAAAYWLTISQSLLRSKPSLDRITLDLEMAATSRSGKTPIGITKKNLNAATKNYALEAARRVKPTAASFIFSPSARSSSRKMWTG